MDASRLIKRAVQQGLDGVVITEHHHIWEDAELNELHGQADEPGFILLAGFEYTSKQGDILVYGLEPEAADTFKPGRPPGEVVDEVRELGGACIAAHPTRAGLGFDEAIINIPFDAIEISSVNLQPHEQRLAAALAENTNLKPVTCSDAHRLGDVGRYATDFFDPIQTVSDLKEALQHGRFRPAGQAQG